MGRWVLTPGLLLRSGKEQRPRQQIWGLSLTVMQHPHSLSCFYFSTSQAENMGPFRHLNYNNKEKSDGKQRMTDE